MRGKLFFAFLFLGFFVAPQPKAQQPFTVEMEEISVPGFPALHSGAWAEHQGKWIFIGGRTNGLHGFLPPLGFPFSGVNDQIFVVDPVTWQMDSIGVDSLPLDIREAVETSNLQFYQDGSMLYLVGGYGWKDSDQEFRTFATLTAVDLDCLIPAVSNQQGLASCFRQISDSSLRICGAHLGRIDSTYQLVWGHLFDGRYDREDTTGFFQQAYSFAVRRFLINDDGQNLSLSHLSAYEDSLNFRRRDYNLVPHIFANGEQGYMGFSGVFLENLNLPYLNPISIRSGGTQRLTAFEQSLAHYHSAVMPVADTLNNYFHTLFFGGMAQYYLDSVSQVLQEDTLIPFVSTISQVSRDPAGNLTEQALSIKMPGLLGTNAHFIPDAAVPRIGEGIIDLNAVMGRSRVGYIVGGMESPGPNISDSDPSLSWANARIFEVYLNKNPNSQAERRAATAPVSLQISPNPFSGPLHIEGLSRISEDFSIELLNASGQKTALLYQSAQKGGFSFDLNRELPAGVYFIRLISPGFSQVYPVLRQ